MPTVSDTEIIVVTDVPLLSSIEGAVYQTRDEKGQAGGYAPLGTDGLVPSPLLPENLVQSVNGQIGVVNLTSADVGAVSSVNGKTGQTITLTNTDVGAIPSTDKGSPNGVASLDGTGKVPSSQLTSIPDSTTTTKGVIQLGGDLGGTAVSPTVPGLASKESTSNKGQANGYAPLDGTGKVPSANLPSSASSTVEHNGTPVADPNFVDVTLTDLLGLGVSADLSPTAVTTTSLTAAPSSLVLADATSNSLTITFPSLSIPDGTRIGVRVLGLGIGKTVTVATGGTDKFDDGTASFVMSLRKPIVTFRYSATTNTWRTQSCDISLSQLDTFYDSRYAAIGTGGGGTTLPTVDGGDPTSTYGVADFIEGGTP